MNNTTVHCHYVQALLDSVKRQGIDPLPLLKEANIAAVVAYDANARVPYENFVLLVRKIWQTLNDEYFGLCSPALPVGSFFYAGHLMVGSPTLRKALTLGMGFYEYVTDACALNLTEKNACVNFEAKLSKPELDPDHLLAELTLTGWHRFACWLIGQNIILKKVGFDFSPPAHEAEYRHIFPYPRKFDQTTLSFQFNAEYLDRPVIQNINSLKKYLKTTPSMLILKPINDDSYHTKIRLLIENYQGAGFPDFEQIAELLHMTGKTLRKKLKAEGTSYQKIKDVMRRDMAIHYLTLQTIPIADIATRVGFSEPGAFIRAFKGWTGATPGAYRNQS